MPLQERLQLPRHLPLLQHQQQLHLPHLLPRRQLLPRKVR